MASLFTKIIQGEIPAHIIDQNEDYFAFLDVFPLVEGHVLVVPKKEVDYLFDLSTAELAGLMAFAQHVAHALRQAVPCKKIGVSVIGLEVPHAHVHLIPMNQVEDMNFSRPKLKPTQEALAQMAGHIRSFL